jgi:hypothetical protein
MTQLGIDLPVVVKTPQGFSTTDVYICMTFQEAVTAVGSILNSITGWSARSARHSSGYNGGTEFAVNLAWRVRKDGGDGCVEYVKTHQALDIAVQAKICDPNDPSLKSIVVCRGRGKAVGIHFGAGHVELELMSKQMVDAILRSGHDGSRG